MSDSPTLHQSGQPLPQINTPVLDASGGWNSAWYRWIIWVWQVLGGQRNDFQTAAFLQQIASGARVIAVNSKSGEQIGPKSLSFGTLVAGGQESISATGSPMTLTASGAGVYVVTGSQVEVARPPAAFVTVSATEAAILLLEGDQLKLTYGAPPTITLLPFTIF